jgi:cellulose synthase/poly-beta-1,6-N-acetylglucosamine synthase-like glycosyltransferase
LARNDCLVSSPFDASASVDKEVTFNSLPTLPLLVPQEYRQPFRTRRRPVSSADSRLGGYRVRKVSGRSGRHHVPVARPVTHGLGWRAAPRFPFVNTADLVTRLDRECRLGRGRGRSFAVVGVAEAERISNRLGGGAVNLVAGMLADLLAGVAGVTLLGIGEDLRCALLIPAASTRTTASTLERLERRLAARTLPVFGEHLRLTPYAGYEDLARVTGGHALLTHAHRSADVAQDRLDLVAVSYESAAGALAAGRTGATKKPGRFRTPCQLALTFVLGLGLPFALYTLLGDAHVDVTRAAYLAVVLATVVTATMIWIEGLLALDAMTPPRRPASAYPPATAIIPAYLPNEAATIVDTVAAFLALDYPAPLQVILAYNTGRPLPIEKVLRDIARADPRLLLRHVTNSTSKAQNVNSVMSDVTGEFVGIFDADHHPAPGSFQRAWRWLSHGYGIVQGHCVIRNGASSWVARMVAVEFEAIYGISHPGRARLHGFGIFGGSNGYWSADLLRGVRLRGDMLTEDIDSAIRTLEGGARIASDPGLISRELAPINLTALAHQRLRWAQGWFQVSLRRLGPALRSGNLRPRNKIGMSFLLGWRELYPWLSLQIWPLLAYRLAHPIHGRTAIAEPLFLVSSFLAFSVGPVQTFFAYSRASDDLRRHTGWFWLYAFVMAPFYTEFKNALARVAHLKEFSGERQWKITPRAPAAAGTGG